MNRWNAIVVKDLLNVGEIEGRVYIGRNYSVSNSHQFGFKLTKNVTSDIVFASGGTVTTNGQANIKVFYGSAAVASAVANRAWFQFMQSGGALSAPSTWAADNSPVAAITSAAVYWRTLTPNSTAQIPSGQPGPLKLICSETEPVAVFNLTDVQTFENRNTQQIELKTSNATKTIIINIKSIDGNVDWSSSNMVSQFNQEYWQCRTIWNFYTDANNGDMGTISMNGNFKGALVAPTATVTTNSNIDGALVCEYLNIQSEVHNPGGGWSGDA
ncbi:MAG: collagen-binding domain-containing protein, partial [Bacteroidota bacterium]